MIALFRALKVINSTRYGNVRKATSYGYVRTPFKPVTMNELPIPRGPWETDNDFKQRVFNVILMSAVVFFNISLQYGMRTSLLLNPAAAAEEPEEEPPAEAEAETEEPKT